MSIAQQIGKVSSDLETRTKLGEFFGLARCMMLGGGIPAEALQISERRFSPRITELLQKSAVNPLSLTTGSSLAEYDALVAAFLTSLAQVSAFDAMLPSMKRVPSRVRVAIVSLGASAYVVGEGAPTGLTSLALDGRSLAEYKTAAILVVSDELLQATSVESAQLFRNELSTAVASVTDEKFVALVTSGLTPIASSGVDLASIWTDLGNLFHAVDTGAGSKLFLLVDPSTAKVLATKTTTTGAAAFPQVGFAGGQIGGATVLVTDALAAGTLLLIDAAAVAASAGSVGLAVVRHGDLQFETVPDSPAISTSVLRSLWQHNLTGLKAERAFGAELLRTSSAALLSAANYRTGNSPS